jgi:hypothetical protein
MFLLVLFFLLRIKESGATEIIIQDGAWWQKATNMEKIISIESLITGYQNGWMNGFMARSVMSTSRKPHILNDLSIRGKLVPVFPQVLGYYIALIDKFYYQYPNKQNISIGQIIACLPDHLLFAKREDDKEKDRRMCLNSLEPNQ